MKTKTVWEELSEEAHYDDERYNNHWLEDVGAVSWNYGADARWLNVYGRMIGDVEFRTWEGWPKGKIIGDEDE